MPPLDYRLRIILIVISFCVSGYIIYKVKKEIIELKYTLIWLFVAIGLIMLSLFPEISGFIAHILRIDIPLNAMIFLTIIFLTILNLILSTTLSKLYIKIVRLTQEIGILKNDVEKLKNKENENLH